MKDKIREYKDIIARYFPWCEIVVSEDFDEEYLCMVRTVKIRSCFGPSSTADREWKMLGELVKIVPKEELSSLRIYAELMEKKK